MFRADKGLSGGSDGKESACNVGDPGSTPGSGRSSGDTLSSIFFFSPVFLTGEFHAERSLVGYRLRGCKELNTTQ